MKKHISNIVNICCFIVILSGVMVAQATGQDRTCQEAGCAKFSYRLASVDSQRGVLLNALVGGLLGGNITLTAGEWENLAQVDVDLLSFLQALDTEVAAGSTELVLDADITLLHIIDAAASVLQTDGNTAALNVLNILRPQIDLLSPLAPIRLGDLLHITTNHSSISDIGINILDLLYGSVALFNYDHVLSTPTPITISAGNVGLGSIANGIELYAQVSEPPVYSCGSSGTEFYSAAVRVKLNVDLIDLSLTQLLLDLGLILPPNVASLNLSLGQVELYADVARAAGTIQTVDAISGALTIDADPAVADLYLGQIDDNVFFTRSGIIDPATDLDFTTIGGLEVRLLGIPISANINARAYAEGNDPFVSTLLFNGPYPETKTVGNSATFISNLVSTLLQSLEVEIKTGGLLVLLQPVFDLLLNNLVPVLLNGLDQILTPILSDILSGLVDPLLQALGIQIGEANITAGGFNQICFGTIAGYVYEDADHSGVRGSAEGGTGLPLYAKLIDSAAPSSVITSVPVDAVSGAYTFGNILGGNYYVLIDDNQNQSDVTPYLPSGWIGTEHPGGRSRIIDLAESNSVALNFGFYHGSKLSGLVFEDTGAGGGTAHNGTKEGEEAIIAGLKIELATADGTTTIDQVDTDGTGSFSLWIPDTYSGQSLQVRQVLATSYNSISGAPGNTSGTFEQPAHRIVFTSSSGSEYTGIRFGNVRPAQFSPQGQQYAVPGSAVFYRHIYVAGTAGSVTFTGTGEDDKWSHAYYHDINENGLIDTGEPLLNTAVTVTAYQELHLIVKVQVPEGVQPGIQYKLNTEAVLALVNTSLQNSSSVIDLTIVGDASGAGMVVEKEVDKDAVKPGETVTYTITFFNRSSEPLDEITVYDTTPAYTVFESAATTRLPASLSCTITDPGSGNAGDVKWDCTGALSPGESGEVQFIVRLL